MNHNLLFHPPVVVYGEWSRPQPFAEAPQPQSRLTAANETSPPARTGAIGERHIGAALIDFLGVGDQIPCFD